MNQIVEVLTAVQSFMERGGDVLIAIFLATFLMWILILERLIYFQMIYPLDLKKSVKQWLGRTDRTSWYAEQIRSLEISKISQRVHLSLPLIKTLVAVCPLLGLLGTVTGMIEVFEIMSLVGNTNARAMASGVSMATIPTMAGMVAMLSGLFFAARLERTAKKKMLVVEERFTQEEV